MPVNRALRSLRQRMPAANPTPWAWAVAGGVLGASVAVLSFAPAHWLAWGVAQASGQRLQLQHARGTVWDGSAQLVLTGGANSRDHASLPGRLQWRLRPQWNGFQAQLQADCCTPSALDLRLQLQGGGLLLSVGDGSSHWPTHVLTGLGTPWNTVQLQGQLTLNTQSLQMQWSAGRWRIHGQAHLDALELSSRLSTLRPLGSYRLTLQGGDTPSLQVRTLQGELQLSGSGQWVGQRLRFSGQASASPGREAALSNLLNLLGRRRGATALITLG